MYLITSDFILLPLLHLVTAVICADFVKGLLQYTNVW